MVPLSGLNTPPSTIPPCVATIEDIWDSVAGSNMLEVPSITQSLPGTWKIWFGE